MERQVQRDYRRSLKIALVVTIVFLLVEIAGGFISGSLALLSDAGHMFSDVLALLLSLAAITIATQLPTKSRTYGYHRVEIFVAFINSLVLIGVSAGIVWEAYLRFQNPSPIEGGLMFFIALIGLVANASIVWLLHGSHDLNIRSAFLHVVGDTLSSVAVMIAAAWITLTGQVIVDPVLSGIIAVIIVISAIRILRETVAILLQFTPQGRGLRCRRQGHNLGGGGGQCPPRAPVEPLFGHQRPRRPRVFLRTECGEDRSNKTGDQGAAEKISHPPFHPGVRVREVRGVCSCRKS